MLRVENVLYEQCYHCHQWFPEQDMRWDDENRALACYECYDLEQTSW